MTAAKGRRSGCAVPSPGKAAGRAVAIIREPLDATPAEKAAAARVIDKTVADSAAGRELRAVLGLDAPA